GIRDFHVTGVQTCALPIYLRRFVDDYEAVPARLAEVEERLSAIYQMARKHRISPKELPELHQRLQAELAELDGGEGSLEQLEAEIGRASCREREENWVVAG